MFKKPFINDDSVLLCPNCDFDYLHHGRVEVFERSREDSETGLHVDIDGQTATIDSRQDHNPSGRRDGLRIFFGCEECDATSYLEVIQHKGQTYLNIGVAEEPDGDQGGYIARRGALHDSLE